MMSPTCSTLSKDFFMFPGSIAGLVVCEVMRSLCQEQNPQANHDSKQDSCHKVSLQLFRNEAQLRHAAAVFVVSLNDPSSIARQACKQTIFN